MSQQNEFYPVSVPKSAANIAEDYLRKQGLLEDRRDDLSEIVFRCKARVPQKQVFDALTALGVYNKFY